jgi:hypothetical protein
MIKKQKARVGNGAIRLTRRALVEARVSSALQITF